MSPIDGGSAMSRGDMRAQTHEQNLYNYDTGPKLTESQIAAIADGTAEIENFIVVKPAAELN